jgi:hypothetical protein
MLVAPRAEAARGLLIDLGRAAIETRISEVTSGFRFCSMSLRESNLLYSIIHRAIAVSFIK